MQLLALVGCALSLRWTSALGLEGLAAVTDAACPYPGVQSLITSCKTGPAFCSSVLGRGPATTTIVVPTYTTTVAKSTFTDGAITTRTISKTTSVATLTITSTTFSCVSSLPPTVAVKVGGAQPAVAAAASCGVGGYSSAWISTACECDYDKTVYQASTTKTKKAGTTIKSTAVTKTTTSTAVKFGTTTVVTSTVLKDNCYPPANATCLNPWGCEGPYYTFFCGSDDEYQCACGYDSHELPTCFREYSVTCGDTPDCVNDYDCADGEFCLYDYCYYTSCYENLPGGNCAKYDTCLGDVVIGVSITFDAQATAAP